MNLSNVDNESECSTQWTHHVHIPRGYANKKLIDRINSEALDQLEPGQNLWAYGLIDRIPVNTNK